MMSSPRSAGIWTGPLRPAYKNTMTDRRRPHILLTLFSLLLICAGIAAGIAGWFSYRALAPGSLDSPALVLIERGSGVSAIGAALAEEGVIDDPLLFTVLARVKGGSDLKAGEYEFPARIAMVDVLQKLKDGSVYDRKVTIREGLTSHQVVQILRAVPELTGEIAEIPAEGSLLPDTYHFIRGDSRGGLIAKMEAAMTRTLDTLWEARADDLPFETKEEALTLASIVEKETAVAAERHRVAGVFVNRLRRGMPLQTDPTVIYALTDGVMEDEGQGPLGRRLLTKDLSVDSPYNTYKNAGLPPGPIANPGAAAIEAALHPEAHDYLYFVADGTGGHAFAATLNQHNRNVAKWRKIRRGN